MKCPACGQPIPDVPPDGASSDGRGVAWPPNETTKEPPIVPVDPVVARWDMPAFACRYRETQHEHRLTSLGIEWCPYAGLAGAKEDGRDG